MEPQTLLLVALLVIIGMVGYSTVKLRNKIHCSFRRVNLTKVEKFIPMNSKTVIFDGGKYKIDTERVTLLWYNRGLNQFFPQWVPSLDYSWYSDVPHNPREFVNTWDTPEARNSASSEEDWRGFNKGMQQQVGKKAGVLSQYAPMIALILVVLVGFVLFTQMQAMAGRMEILEQMIKATRAGG